MKQLYRERQQDIQDLKSALSDMESQLQKKDAQIKGLLEENEAVMTEKTQMGLQVKRLKFRLNYFILFNFFSIFSSDWLSFLWGPSCSRELSKLNKFRMNIIKSINQETLADDLTEVIYLPRFNVICAKIILTLTLSILYVLHGAAGRTWRPKWRSLQQFIWKQYCHHQSKKQTVHKPIWEVCSHFRRSSCVSISVGG